MAFRMLTPNTSNAVWVSILVKIPCTKLLRDVLQHHVPETLFPIKLQSAHLKIKTCLNASQKGILYPPRGKFKGSYQDFDIPLLYIFLKHVSGIVAHEQKWGNKPSDTDASVSANIERIRIIYQISLVVSSLTDEEFDKIFQDLRQIASDLVKDLDISTNYVYVLDKIAIEREKANTSLEENSRIENIKSTTHTVKGIQKAEVKTNVTRFTTHNAQYLQNVDFKFASMTEKITDEEKRININLFRNELSLRNLSGTKMTSFDDNIVCRWRAVSTTTKCVFDGIDFINCEGVFSNKTVIGRKMTCSNLSLSNVSSADLLNKMIYDTNCKLTLIKQQSKQYCPCFIHFLRFQISVNVKKVNKGMIVHEREKYQSILEKLYQNDHAIPIYHLLKNGCEIASSPKHCPVIKQSIDVTMLCLRKRIREKENNSVVIVRSDLCWIYELDKIVVVAYFNGMFYGSANSINGLNVIWRKHHSLNDEAKVVLEHQNSEIGSDLSVEMLPSLNRKEAWDLFKRHSNLTMISASRYKSVGFREGKHAVSKLTCITLFCKCKGFIPFGESKFPPKIKSIDVDVLEGYCCFASDTVQIGQRIGAEGQNKTGSIGGFVELENNGIGLVTCAHVLYSVDDLVYNRLNPNINIYTTSRTIPSGSVLKAVFRHSDHRYTSVDAALIKIDQPISSSFPDIDLQQLRTAGLNEQPCFHTGETLPSTELRHQSVVKYGPVSKFTSGKLTLDRSHVRIENIVMRVLPTDESWGSMTRNIPESVIMYGQYSVDSNSNSLFFMPGDSGSFVFVVEENGDLQIQTLKCIGMAIGIERGTNKCIITPIESVLEALRLESGSELKLKTFNFNPTDGNQKQMRMLLASSQRVERDLGDLKQTINAVKKDAADFKRDVNKRLSSLESALRQDTNTNNMASNLANNNI